MIGERLRRTVGIISSTCRRMTQGFSIGGEFTSSVVFLVERAPEGRRGLMGGLAISGATGGILLGSAVCAAFAAALPTTALETWGLKWTPSLGPPERFS